MISSGSASLVCALAFTGIGWLKQIAGTVAQGLLAPVGVVIYMPDPHEKFVKWCWSLIESFKPPNMAILVFDEGPLPAWVTVIDSALPFIPRAAGAYGLVLIRRNASPKIVGYAMRYLAPGGTLIFHEGTRVLMTVNKAVKESA